MESIHRDDLHRGGFAGLRETRMVMDPRAWGSHVEAGAQPGIGNFVYLADARFLPHGDTGMHPHREIDVISVMVEGRISHQGSLEHGQELRAFDVQVQRAGGEGFSHNEVNPDEFENRMIQLWILPEIPGQAAGYQVFQVQAGERTRVYGGPAGQSETFASRTVMEVARLQKGERLELRSPSIAYITTGSGQADGQAVREGHLLRGEGLDLVAEEDSMVILLHGLQ